MILVMEDVLGVLLGALVGTGLGTWTFVRSSRALGKKRLVESVPTSKCRSVAMGLVEVAGKASGETTIPSLVGGIPCYYTQVRIVGREKTEHSSVPRDVHRRSRSIDFYVEDSTGRVRVQPAQAEFDLSRDIDYENAEGKGTWREGALPHTEGEADPLLTRFSNYCTLQGIPWQVPMHFQETNLCPGDAVYVLGTATEAAGERDEYRRVLIRKGRNDAWFFIAESSQKEVLEKLGRKAWRNALALAALYVTCCLIFVSWLLGRLGVL